MQRHYSLSCLPMDVAKYTKHAYRSQNNWLMVEFRSYNWGHGNHTGFKINYRTVDDRPLKDKGTAMYSLYVLSLYCNLVQIYFLFSIISRPVPIVNNGQPTSVDAIERHIASMLYMQWSRELRPKHTSIGKHPLCLNGGMLS